VDQGGHIVGRGKGGVFGNSVQCTFQASCRSPDDSRGQLCFRGDGVSCWCTVTICKKSPEKAAVAITAAKSQNIVALHHAVLAVADFAMLFGILRRCLGALESLVFYVKKSCQTV
jgi:hypothetical protein